MRLIIIIIAILFSTDSFSQVKPGKKVASPSQKAIYTNKAKTWFKDVYVQSYFKDPYSYKLMKIELYPTTFDEKYKKLIETAGESLSNIDTSKSYSPYQSGIRTYKALMHFPRDTTDYVILNQKREIANDLKDYIGLKESLNSLNKTYNEMAIKQKNSVYEYLVYIECYGRNGYGNLALNKYSFTLNVNGDFGEVTSID